MNHRVVTLFLIVSFSLCAENGNVGIVDKTKRIGRFSYEDSFDESTVDAILNNSPIAVKKNVMKLLYPSKDAAAIPKRLLLLGQSGSAGAATIAKAIAVRCGYEYYVVEASLLLKEYRDGRQTLLREIYPVLNCGKPVAIIVTEFPEMTEYSGLLASTLWLLLDQCSQYSDVVVIGTSQLEKSNLSPQIKERFGGEIISVSLKRSLRTAVEDSLGGRSGFNGKIVCGIIGGAACVMLGATHVLTQIFFEMEHTKRENENLLWQKRRIELQEEITNAQLKQGERLLRILSNATDVASLSVLPLLGSSIHEDILGSLSKHRIELLTDKNHGDKTPDGVDFSLPKSDS